MTAASVAAAAALPLLCRPSPAASLLFLRFPSLSPLLRLRRRRRCPSAAASVNPPPPPQQQQQQMNLSVLRFTLGIPGLDESFLPRYIGVGFGALIVLNHFLSPDPTAAQIRSEILGLGLAAFSATLPYLGRFLKGTNSVNRSPIQDGSKQIFTMSKNSNVALEEDMAWASYAILRNTNTISMLIVINDALCVRGYWNISESISKEDILEFFKTPIQQAGLLNFTETFYSSRFSEPLIGNLLPIEVRSVLIQPLSSSPISNDRCPATPIRGFVLLASNMEYAYSDKDIAWIKTVTRKFQEQADLADIQAILN